MGVKAWRVGDAGMPKFPDDFDIVKKAVLQKTDFGENNNKYYGIELHKDKAGKKFRVYTHYGRTDDLEKNPNSGAKECRFAESLAEADEIYSDIFRQKTSKTKGYKELNLASSKIGSAKARGTSSGEVDSKTLQKLEANKKGKPKTPAVKQPDLHPNLNRLIKYIFSEATHKLTTTVSATITANGIETPLGVLTIGQVEKGEAILTQIYNLLQQKKSKAQDYQKLSGEFYTVIPHRIGRTRDQISASVICTLASFKQKQDTCQLMKDMLQVNGDGGNVLFDKETHSQYQSLKCDLVAYERGDKIYKEMEKYVLDSQISRGIKIKNVFGVKRPNEWSEFTNNISNHRLLFHGSAVSNWVGLLSRGILMPKVVVKMGVHRTDAGWLGNGIYFGDAACTSANYAASGDLGTSFLSINRVALGKIKKYEEITYGLNSPPSGFHSCHGVRGTEFDDDEFVIYDGKQQKMEYLIEFEN